MIKNACFQRRGATEGFLPENSCLSGVFRDGARKVRWSYHIASVAGIQVRVHVTFLLLLGFYAWVYYTEGGFGAATAGVAFTLLIFLCVLLHEFGHAFAARAFKIRTPDITLLPIGGVARLERMPSNPWQELVIAIAGPAVNVVIAVAIFLLMKGVLPMHELDLIDTPSGSLAAKLLFVNILLVAFNVIPAFPMDGGRVLRALLATQMRYVSATRLAARVGQIIAILFVGVSLLWGGPILAFIGIFIFLGAQQELAYARLRQTAQSLRVGQAMITRFQTLPSTLKVAEIVPSLEQSEQDFFPFVDEGWHLLGLASREELEKAAQQLPPESPASCVARRVPAVSPETRFEEALELMHRFSEPLLPVLNASGQIIGFVSVGHLAQLANSKEPERF